VQGGGSILNAGLGIPTSLSATILATMAVLFAATTMDTGVRLQRFVVQEIGEVLGTHVSKYVGTAIVLAVAMGLTFSAGAGGEGGMRIWPLFGTTNQLLAGLTLAVITVILIKLGRSPVYTLVPLVFLLAMSIYALLVQMGQFYRAENWLLLGMDVIILIAALWVTLEAIIAMRKGRDPAERAFEAQP
jgi:carbon starvation protein